MPRQQFLELKEVKEASVRAAEERKKDPNSKKDVSKHYFTMMKELTLTGFFTSEVGATKALRYVAIPGRFEGCVPYKKGDKAWA